MKSKYKKVIFLNMFDVRKYQKKKKKIIIFEYYKEKERIYFKLFFISRLS